MPRYYFHFHNGDEAWDEEGRELADLETARDLAIAAARDMIASDVRQGRVLLSSWIEVQDEGGAQVFCVRFGDAVTFNP